MHNIKDLTNKRFGDLIALKPTDRRGGGKNGNVYWKVYDLKKHAIRLVRQDNIQRDPTYKCWDNMIGRCDRPSTRGYHYWGGRGIRIEDPRWYDYNNFLADMGEKPKGMTLERLDNDRGYSAANCAWRSWKEQIANRRPYGSVR